MNLTTKELALAVVAVTTIIMVSVTGWSVARKVNYSLSYEGQVKQTIREMVKEDSLK